MPSRTFSMKDLVLVQKFEPENPPLQVGEFARLNFGGPALEIIDIQPNSSDAEEDTLYFDDYSWPRACVRRVKPTLN